MRKKERYRDQRTRANRRRLSSWNGSKVKQQLRRHKSLDLPRVRSQVTAFLRSKTEKKMNRWKKIRKRKRERTEGQKVSTNHRMFATNESTFLREKIVLKVASGSNSSNVGVVVAVEVVVDGSGRCRFCNKCGEGKSLKLSPPPSSIFCNKTRSIKSEIYREANIEKPSLEIAKILEQKVWLECSLNLSLWFTIKHLF